MSFYKKYELDRLIASGETKTFRATEKNSGRAVFVHLFEPEARSLIRDLRDKLESGGQAQLPLIEIGEFAESPYAVTEIVDPFPGLRPWIRSLGPLVEPAPDAAARSPEPNLATPAKPDPGEFTRLFSAPADQQPREPHAPAPPGEFTRLFAPVQPLAKPPAPEPPPAREPVPIQAVPQIPAEKGDFTRLFGPGLQGEAIDIEREQERARSLPVTGGRPFEPAGDFTRMFGPHPAAPEERANSAVPPPPLVETKLGRGLATTVSRMFGRPQTDPPSGSLPQPAPAQEGPGEYTRLILGPGSQPANRGRNEPAPSNAAARPPLASPGKTKFRLIATTAVLFVLLVVLLLLTRR